MRKGGGLDVTPTRGAAEDGWLDIRVPGPVRRHPVRAAMVLVPLALVGAIAYSLSSYWLRAQPGAKSVSAAVQELRGSAGHGVAGGGAFRYPPPSPGVYSLAGSGAERISFPPNSQRDGSVMPATVTTLGHGCWRWRLDYNVAHWEEYDFCASGTQLVQAANRNGQRWDFGSFSVSNTARFTCPAGTDVLPADVSVGQEVRWTCTGENSAVPGATEARTTVQMLGTQDLRIAGTSVRAVHERQDTVLSGSQRGTVVMEWWFSASTGLPLRVSRTITISTASPVGDITYTESGSWRMTSLDPRR